MRKTHLPLLKVERCETKNMNREDCQIFVVDDDDAVRDSLCVMLRTAYPYVDGYASGAGFLKHHRPRRRNCLIIDFHMPEMNGVEVLDELRSSTVQIPVIMLTGRGSAELRLDAIAAGATAVLDKPVEFDVLMAAIHACISVNGRSAGTQTPLSD
jgi:two-component system response regulator FixJ